MAAPARTMARWPSSRAARCSSAPSAGPTCWAPSTPDRMPSTCTVRCTRRCSASRTRRASCRRTARARSARVAWAQAWSSTVGIERATDPLLAIEDPDAFADALLAGQPAVPRYFARMRGINRAGPRMLGTIPAPQPLDVAAVRDRLAGGAQLIDLRPAAAFAAAYVPGSISLPADASFGTWLGWVVDPDRPLVLLLPDAGRLGRRRPPGAARGLRHDRRLSRRWPRGVACCRWRHRRRAGLDGHRAGHGDARLGPAAGPRRATGRRVRGRPRARSAAPDGRRPPRSA